MRLGTPPPPRRLSAPSDHRWRELVPAGVDTVLDTVGNRIRATMATAARDDARTASVADVGHPGVTPVFCRLNGEDLRAVAELADAALLMVRVGATHPLERTANAQRALTAGAPTARSS
ncbi:MULTISPECIES: zinc-binding dehydrogenase [unclassified Streptomyces]|uniref:zinc-binding dehydrogenase n=1 Tax=unclassified Streptomyces TaxID=2593676 RepID=UPI003D906008